MTNSSDFLNNWNELVLMQFTEMFMADGKRSLEQMEHLAKRGKVIGDRKF